MSNISDKFRPFRGLSITREQDREIRTYIEQCEAGGSAWDTLALDFMVQEMLYPTPTNERIEICDEYASNLANRVRRTGLPLDNFTREAYAENCGACTDAEWKWIVREAGRRL
jgi:hypothetical protein